MALKCQLQKAIYKMEVECNSQRFVRILDQFKIILLLHQDQLSLKLFTKRDDLSFYEGQFTFQNIGILFNTIFSSLQQIFTQFKSIPEELLTFNKNYELVYTVNLITKKLKLIFPLRAKQKTRQEELLLENIVLNCCKNDYEQTIVEKNKEIHELKSQIQKFKELINNLKQNNNYSSEDKQNNMNNQNFALINSASQNNDAPHCANPVEVVPPSNQEQIEQQSYKRSKETLEHQQPLTYFSKTNEVSGQPQRKQIIKRTNYPFTLSKLNQKCFTWQNNKIKLICSGTNYLFFDQCLPTVGTTIMGLKIVKKAEKPKKLRIGMRFGLKLIQKQSEKLDKSPGNLINNTILLGLQTGRFRVYQGMKAIVSQILLPINEEETVHLRIEQGQKPVLSWFYKRQKFRKDFLLPQVFSKQNLIPFIEMSHQGDEVQFMSDS